MAQAQQLTVKVITPNQVVYEGPAGLILAPGKKDILGILPGHTPMFAELIKGQLIIKNEKEELLAIESGILRVRNDEVTILVSRLSQ